MKEPAKTVVFVSVAALAVAILVVVSWSSQSWLPELQPQDQIGKPLFKPFKPLALTDLQIVKHDEATGTANRFQVTQVDDLWSIPSHENYQTDAEDQLSDAASSVMGLTVLSVETDNPGDHGLFGVLDPTSKELESGAALIASVCVMVATAPSFAGPANED